MFQALKTLNLTYDSTMPTSAMNPPIWPFTLDYGVTHVMCFSLIKNGQM